jgi:hypothetical protein
VKLAVAPTGTTTPAKPSAVTTVAKPAAAAATGPAKSAAAEATTGVTDTGDAGTDPADTSAAGTVSPDTKVAKKAPKTVREALTEETAAENVRSAGSTSGDLPQTVANTGKLAKAKLDADKAAALDALTAKPAASAAPAASPVAPAPTRTEDTPATANPATANPATANPATANPAAKAASPADQPDADAATAATAPAPARPIAPMRPTVPSPSRPSTPNRPTSPPPAPTRPAAGAAQESEPADPTAGSQAPAEESLKPIGVAGRRDYPAGSKATSRRPGSAVKSDTQPETPEQRTESRPLGGADTAEAEAARTSNYAEEAAELLAGLAPGGGRRRKSPTGLPVDDELDEMPFQVSRLPRKGPNKPE